MIDTLKKMLALATLLVAILAAQSAQAQVFLNETFEEFATDGVSVTTGVDYDYGGTGYYAHEPAPTAPTEVATIDSTSISGNDTKKLKFTFNTETPSQPANKFTDIVLTLPQPVPTTVSMYTVEFDVRVMNHGDWWQSDISFLLRRGTDEILNYKVDGGGTSVFSIKSGNGTLHYGAADAFTGGVRDWDHVAIEIYPSADFAEFKVYRNDVKLADSTVSAADDRCGVAGKPAAQFIDSICWRIWVQANGTSPANATDYYDNVVVHSGDKDTVPVELSTLSVE